MLAMASTSQVCSTSTVSSLTVRRYFPLAVWGGVKKEAVKSET